MSQTTTTAPAWLSMLPFQDDAARRHKADVHDLPNGAAANWHFWRFMQRLKDEHADDWKWLCDNACVRRELSPVRVAPDHLSWSHKWLFYPSANAMRPFALVNISSAPVFDGRHWTETDDGTDDWIDVDDEDAVLGMWRRAIAHARGNAAAAAASVAAPAGPATSALSV